MEIDEEDDDDTMVDPDFVAVMNLHVHVDSASADIDITQHADTRPVIRSITE